MADPTHCTTLGEVLRAARIRTGMTQEQLAGLSTVSVRAIRDLEQGRVANPRRDTVRLLADAMRLCGVARARLESTIEGPVGGGALSDARPDTVAPPPVPLRPLLGRRDEVGPLIELLESRQRRLVTLIGLPGVGKSRLAQELALLMHGQFGTTVLWAGLDQAERDARPDPPPARGREGEAVTASVMSPLMHGGDLADLAALVGDRLALLVLDGFQPNARGAARLAELLATCEGLTVLTTSRSPEPMADGARIPITGLVSGEASPRDHGAAVELMLSFVRCLRPGLPLTAETRSRVGLICYALDGLPRALEEAADWLLLLSPEQISEIAVRDPLALAGEALAADLTDALPAPSSRLEGALARLATMPDRWTLDAAAETLSLSVGEAAEIVRALVIGGLARRASVWPTHGGGRASDGFEVLNLVRHAVARREGAALRLERMVPLQAASRRTGGVV